MPANDPEPGSAVARAKGPPGRTPLEGRSLRLEPLDPERHAGDLFAVSAEDPSIWTYMPYGPFEDLAAMTAWLEDCARSEDPLTFALVERDSGRAAGMASYMAIRPEHGVIEIGGIWFSKVIRRRRAASEAIFLMISASFDDLGYRRVEWKCDAANAASRSAAGRFGFAYEGTFPQHMIVKGRNRDTAWFSILDGEWPGLRSTFETWLEPDNFDERGRQRRSLSALTVACSRSPARAVVNREAGMRRETVVRAPSRSDFDQWLSLWDGYNAFYRREGPSALPGAVTRMTWERFFDAYEPVHALVAECEGRLLGLAHFIFHRSTTMVGPSCYLQDLFTDEGARGRGIGRALIEAVYDRARRAGAARVYWQTHESNETAMKLYDRIAERSGFVVYSKTI